MKRFLTLCCLLLFCAAMLGAQVQINGYQKAEVIAAFDESVLPFFATSRLNFAYENEDQTIGARMHLSASYSNQTGASLKTEMLAAYGWADFLDHQIRLTAGHLQNYDYTVQSSIFPFDSPENSGIYSLANDNWELDDVIGAMLQYMPAQIEGLSAAAVFESSNYKSGWAALYAAAKYENDLLSVVATSHFNDDFASTRASLMLGVKPAEGLDLRAGIKCNMAPTLLLGSNNSELGLYTAFGLIDWNWNELHVRLSPAYVINSNDSSNSQFAGEGYVSYDIIGNLSLIEYAGLLNTFSMQGEYTEVFGTFVRYKLDKAVFKAACYYSLSGVNTFDGSCIIYF